VKTLLPRATVFSISENPEKHEDEVKKCSWTIFKEKSALLK